MNLIDYFNNTKYFFFGSMLVLIGVLYYFLGSLNQIQRSPGVNTNGVSLFWVFFLVGFVLIGLGWYLKILEVSNFKKI